MSLFLPVAAFLMLVLYVAVSTCLYCGLSLFLLATVLGSCYVRASPLSSLILSAAVFVRRSFDWLGLLFVSRDFDVGFITNSEFLCCSIAFAVITCRGFWMSMFLCHGFYA